MSTKCHDMHGLSTDNYKRPRLSHTGGLVFALISPSTLNLLYSCWQLTACVAIKCQRLWVKSTLELAVFQLARLLAESHLAINGFIGLPVLKTVN